MSLSEILFDDRLGTLLDRGLLKPPFAMWRMAEDAAARVPAAVWAKGDYGVLTYAEGWAVIRRLATHLQRSGVGPGDRVALCMPNHPAFALVTHAVWLLGAVVSALHPAYAEVTQAAQLSLIKPHLLVTANIGDLVVLCERLGNVTG